MPNYNLKQIFEIGAGFESQICTQPVRAIAHSQVPSGANPILGAITGRCPSPLSTSLCKQRNGYIGNGNSAQDDRNGRNSCGNSGDGRRPKQRKPIVEVQKIKRTWEDKNSIDRRLFEMMLKSSEHATNVQVTASGRNKGGRTGFNKVGSHIKKVIPCQFRGAAGKLNANSIGTRLGCDVDRLEVHNTDRLARPLEARTLKGYFVTLFSSGGRQVVLGTGAPSEEGSEAATQKKALIDEKIEYHTLLNVRKIYNEFSGTKNHIFEFLKTFCNFILSFEAGAFVRVAGPLGQDTHQFPILSFVPAIDRQHVSQDQSSNRGTRKSGTSAGGRGTLASGRDRAQPPTAPNTQIEETDSREGKRGKNRIGFLVGVTGMDYGCESSTPNRVLAKVSKGRSVRQLSQAQSQDPINLLTEALLEDATQSQRRGISKFFDDSSSNIIKKIESKVQATLRPLQSCPIGLGSSKANLSSDQFLLRQLPRRESEFKTSSDAAPKEAALRGNVIVDHKLPLVSTSKDSSLLNWKLRPSTQNDFFPSERTEKNQKNLEGTQKLLFLSTDYLSQRTDANADGSSKLPQLFVLNLQFSPFCFCFCINVWAAKRTMAFSMESWKEPSLTTHLDKKPWYRPSTIAFLNLYPSAIQSISSLVAGIYKKLILPGNAPVNDPDGAPEEFIHTAVGAQTASIWAGLSRHIHQKSIEFVFRTEHVYASIFYLRCYWLYLYNHFFPSEFFFSLAQYSKTGRPKTQSLFVPLLLGGPAIGRRSAISSSAATGESRATTLGTMAAPAIQNPIQASRRGTVARSSSLYALSRHTHMQVSRASPSATVGLGSSKANPSTHKMIIETTKTQGAHKILSSNFSARRLKSRYYSSSHCICVPSCPVNETRPGAGGHAKKLISLILFHRHCHSTHKNQKNQKPNFNDFLLKTARPDVALSLEGGGSKSPFSDSVGKKQSNLKGNWKNKAKRWASASNYNVEAQYSVRKAQILRTDVTLTNVATLIGLSF